MLKTVCGHVIAADSLTKIAWLSEFVCGGLVVVGGLYLLYSPITLLRKQWLPRCREGSAMMQGRLISKRPSFECASAETNDKFVHRVNLSGRTNKFVQLIIL